MSFAVGLLAGKIHGGEQYRTDFWRKIAIATRYGRMTLHEAMAMPSNDMSPFLRAINELISDENRAPGRSE